MAPPLPPPFMVSKFRTGRSVYGVGKIVGLIGSGLSLSSIILTSAYGLGPGPGGLYGPPLAYAGSSATAAGFILSAAGLGVEHSALAMIGADPGRGLYGAGTAFGILGLLAAGTSYYFAFSNYNNGPEIAFGTAISAAVLLSVGGIFYVIDNQRVNHIFARLTTF
jgi:hypothetical protein